MIFGIIALVLSSTVYLKGKLKCAEGWLPHTPADAAVHLKLKKYFCSENKNFKNNMQKFLTPCAQSQIVSIHDIRL